jgi:hypothetical protein
VPATEQNQRPAKGAENVTGTELHIFLDGN